MNNTFATVLAIFGLMCIVAFFIEVKDRADRRKRREAYLEAEKARQRSLAALHEKRKEEAKKVATNLRQIYSAPVKKHNPIPSNPTPMRKQPRKRTVVEETTTIYETSSPSSNDDDGSAMMGAAIGALVGAALASDDDRPSFTSGGGGDFGGGGASSSWDDSSSSSSSSSDYSSSSSDSSSYSSGD